MSWQDLLSSANGGGTEILPWTGEAKVYSQDRAWTISGRRPPEYGWYSFNISGGRKATVGERHDLAPELPSTLKTVRGYLVGDRMILDSARVELNVDRMIEQTESVYLIEEGLERFSRVAAARWPDGKLIYVRQEFPQGPEPEVQHAYQDRKSSVSDIANVTPALDLAFRWESHQRVLVEERRRQLEAQRIEEERRQRLEEQRQEAVRNMGTAIGRRVLAAHDFEAAARAALALSGAELLDARPSRTRGEMVVHYRYEHRRLECVVARDTLRIIDAGICLAGHDAAFTLESLIGVLREAVDTHRLHVTRNVDGHEDDDFGARDEDW